MSRKTIFHIFVLMCMITSVVVVHMPVRAQEVTCWDSYAGVSVPVGTQNKQGGMWCQSDGMWDTTPSGSAPPVQTPVYQPTQAPIQNYQPVQEITTYQPVCEIGWEANTAGTANVRIWSPVQGQIYKNAQGGCLQYDTGKTTVPACWRSVTCPIQAVATPPVQANIGSIGWIRVTRGNWSTLAQTSQVISFGYQISKPFWQKWAVFAAPYAEVAGTTAVLVWAAGVQVEYYYYLEDVGQLTKLQALVCQSSMNMGDPYALATELQMTDGVCMNSFRQAAATPTPAPTAHAQAYQTKEFGELNCKNAYTALADLATHFPVEDTAFTWFLDWDTASPSGHPKPTFQGREINSHRLTDWVYDNCSGKIQLRFGDSYGKGGVYIRWVGR